jgi:hypothetical protein
MTNEDRLIVRVIKQVGDNYEYYGNEISPHFYHFAKYTTIYATCDFYGRVARKFHIILTVYFYQNL